MSMLIMKIDNFSEDFVYDDVVMRNSITKNQEKTQNYQADNKPCQWTALYSKASKDLHIS